MSPCNTMRLSEGQRLKHSRRLHLSVSWRAVNMQVTEYETTANVLRGGKWQVLPSSQLVPGDVIKIRSNWLLPCDCVIVQGKVTCTVAMLQCNCIWSTCLCQHSACCIPLHRAKHTDPGQLFVHNGVQAIQTCNIHLQHSWCMPLLASSYKPYLLPCCRFVCM